MAFGKNVEIYIDEPIIIEDAIAAIKKLAEASLKEENCLFFQFSQDRDDPRHIFLWEVFKDLAAFQEHHKQQHTINFIGQKLFRKIASINLDVDF
ncbi:putative quinol monooxygenase [Pseudaquidulcibacter saccharophilus]|uniref:putative quinol monooxygenase n=1 Tax=Pseudaquidulcibacter saccharophilus TaxID=2831900 RepID=UPI001EFF47CE|nr:antibiotic biosynthesis monooxygenase [Pseudaquidulcibacter saccharophilus]